MRTLRNFIIGLILVIGAIAAMLFIPSPQPPAAKPWEVTIMPDGNVQVLGIHLANTTYKTAQETLGTFGETAIFRDPNNSLSVEAFFNSINLSGLSAKLVLNLDVKAKQLEAMLKRATSGKLQPSGAYQHEIAEVDRIALLKTPVNAITYIPTVRLDETMITSRFGEPDTKQQSTDPDGVTINSWHYTSSMLTVNFSEKEKTVLIYRTKSTSPDQLK